VRLDDACRIPPPLTLQLGVRGMPEIQCFVEECVFNQAMLCHASRVEVRSNGNDVVGTSMGTMCRTFRYRDFDDGDTEM
jgi:hypothetical protein